MRTRLLLLLSARAPAHAAGAAHAGAEPFWNDSSLLAGLLALAVMIALLHYRSRQRDEAARKLHDSETRYALAMRGTNEGLWDWDPIHHDLYLSSRLLTVLGMQADHLSAHSDVWLARIHPDDRPVFQHTLIGHLKGNTPHFECEYRVIDQEGQYRWVLARGLAQRDAAGVAYRMVGSIGDITERKRDEARLREELAFNRTLIDSLPAALFIANVRKELTLCNAYFQRKTGIQASELASASLASLAVPADRALLDARIEQALACGEASGEFTVAARNGPPWPAEFIGRRLVIAGEPRVLCIATDISAQIAAQRTLHDLNTELERRVSERTAALATALTELESFSYSVSHDLRAPLRAIDGYCALLQSDHGPQLGEDANRMIARMRAASQRMGHLIDGLLSLARVSRAPVRRNRVDLSQLAAELIEELRHAEPARCVQTDLEPGLTAMADPQLVRSLLQNLLGNAWKFTQNTPGARITLRQGTLGPGEAGFCIEDNGAGFDMAYADKLFSPFQRLHAEREFAGTGIGLAIVARIVARHGGKVRAEGEPGQGARIHFTLEEPPA